MNWRNAGILFLVLIVPILLMLLFNLGNTKLIDLPIFGGKQWNGTDSIDYSVDLNELIVLPPSLNDVHFLVYFSENEEGVLHHDAIENIEKVAIRLEEAQKHPSHPVKDIYILSISNSNFKNVGSIIWRKFVTNANIEEFVEKNLQNGFGKSEHPIKDHLSYLIDKDGRVRAVYYTAHGKFENELLGELAVLQNEYGSK